MKSFIELDILKDILGREYKKKITSISCGVSGVSIEYDGFIGDKK